MFTELKSWIVREEVRAEKDLPLLCSTVEDTLAFEAGGHSWIKSGSGFTIWAKYASPLPIL